ncbi:MAG: glutamate 5-kinase [Marinifilaceae bacterium]
MTTEYKRIVVKIGSNVLTRPDRRIDITRLSSLVDQIATLREAGIEVIMVSSGAVACGRSLLNVERKLDEVSARQIYSSVGQAKLIHLYWELFGEYQMTCGQVLTTKESFATRRHYLTQQNCIRCMLENEVIPIVNENDTVSVTELMFTDNDELSGMIATMMDAQALIILSNIDGLYDGDPRNPSSKVIERVESKAKDLSTFIQTSKSSFGRGGMQTKTRIAQKVASEGVEVIIANGTRDNILPDLLFEPTKTVCTRFVAAPQPLSNVKRWIAHSEGFAKGAIYLNQGAYEAMFAAHATSILPVGVNKVEGQFEKDDIVRVYGPNGEYVGVGKINYDSEKAQAIAGEAGARAMIHYDYLFVE